MTIRNSTPSHPIPTHAWIPGVAGVLYLVIIVCGVWSDGFVRSQLIVAGDAQQTAANILEAESLFRLSFFADSLMVLCDVGLAVLLFELLRGVSAPIAALATAFRVTQAAVLGLNLLNQHLSLSLLTGTHALDVQTRNALALLFAEAQGYGYDLGLLFFGINCVLTGIVVFCSGFAPRWIGVLVAASGPVYLIGSSLRFLSPEIAEGFQRAYMLPLVAETAFCLWLLVAGYVARSAPSVAADDAIAGA